MVLTPGVVDAVRGDVYGEGSDGALEFVGLDVVGARQWEGQDAPLVGRSSCIVKGGIPSSRRYLPTYLPCRPSSGLQRTSCRGKRGGVLLSGVR